MDASYGRFVFSERREGGVIALHHGLQSFPVLRDMLLEHESQHTGRLSLNDFLLDVSTKGKPGLRELWRFFLEYPDALLFFILPFSLTDDWGKCYYDLNAIVCYLLSGVGLFFLWRWLF
jgi:hypothetical protein